VFEAFTNKGIKDLLMNLATNHISDIMTEIMTAKYICVGSPTLNNGMLPQIGAFLTYMKGLAPKNRTALAFGSYGWGGQSVGLIEDIFKSCGFRTFEGIKAQWIPGVVELAEITARVERDIDMDKGGEK
jgi:flavorubredoxin